MSKEELEDDYWTMRETDAINNSIENKKLKQQVADLEAKLAESEEKYKKAYQEGLLQKQFDKDMEIEQLKKQLAEKDLKIIELETKLNLKDKETNV